MTHVADLPERPERQVITARQDIYIQPFYTRRRLVTAESLSQIMFRIQGRHIFSFMPHIQKQGHAPFAKQCTSATMAALWML